MLLLRAPWWRDGEEKDRKMFAIKIIGKNAWLNRYDPEAPGDGRYPTGSFDVTFDPKEALLFESPATAIEFWRTQSKTVPLRPDGKANRPLTALAVEVEDIDDAVLGR